MRRRGLYAALGLFLSSDLQFARRTVQDLLDLAQWSDTELTRTALAAFFGGVTAQEIDLGAGAGAAAIGRRSVARCS